MSFEKLHYISSTCLGIIEEEEEFVVLYPKYPKCAKSFALSYGLLMIDVTYSVASEIHCVAEEPECLSLPVSLIFLCGSRFCPVSTGADTSELSFSELSLTIKHTHI